MKYASDYRQEARTALASKWDMAILSTLLFTLLTGAANSTAIGGFLINGPLTVGYFIVMTDIFYSIKPKIESMFDGFTRCFVNSMLTYILKTLLIAVGLILLIVPGIIVNYHLSMALYIQKDNPEMSATDCLKASKEMMNGHKYRLFCLHLSFFGWILLSVLTFGILFIFTAPYMSMAEVAFYEDLKQSR